MEELPDWLLQRLACPRDHRPLSADATGFLCDADHSYSIADGIPTFLLVDHEPIHPELEPTGEYKTEERRSLHEAGVPHGVDGFVQAEVVRTCGNLYNPVLGKLDRYPIPEVRVVPEDGRGKRFLDIGCNWGRWSVAASRLGYDVVGIDPMLDALRAARRVAGQLGSPAEFLAGDARWLPFADGSFDVVFSYSVLQHFAKKDVLSVLDEVARVLAPGGLSVVEMPTAAGFRNLLVRAKRAISSERLDPLDFHVRYWPLDELVETFTHHVGPTRVEVDSFFFINGQPADRDLLPARYRAGIVVSEFLRRAAKPVPVLTRIADSVYLASRKQAINEPV